MNEKEKAGNHSHSNINCHVALQQELNYFLVGVLQIDVSFFIYEPPVRTYRLNLPSFPHIFKIPSVLITNITVRALCSDIPAAFAKSLDVNSLFSTAGIKFSASQGFRSSIISATVNGILSARLTFFLDPFISDMYLY